MVWRGEIDSEALKLGEATGTRTITRVRLATFQERIDQWLRGLASVVVRQAAQAELTSSSRAVLLLSEIGNSRCFRLRAPVPGHQMDRIGLVSLRVCS